MSNTTPESRFVRRVNKLLPSEVYSEGMANPYRGGTPDRYYEGPANCLWVEYKYMKAVPATYKVEDHVTPLQIKWIRRAQSNKVPVVIVCGFGKHGLVLTQDMFWEITLHREDIKKHMLPIQDIAAFIHLHCVGIHEKREVYPH